MRAKLLAATATAALFTLSASAEEAVFTATLEGHAILPAATFIPPPADAPPSLAHAAKYTTPDRHRPISSAASPARTASA
jgi:hypothetical protein